jgi:hypothetical protein
VGLVEISENVTLQYKTAEVYPNRLEAPFSPWIVDGVYMLSTADWAVFVGKRLRPNALVTKRHGCCTSGDQQESQLGGFYQTARGKRCILHQCLAEVKKCPCEETVYDWDEGT